MIGEATQVAPESTDGNSPPREDPRLRPFHRCHYTQQSTGQRFAAPWCHMILGMVPPMEGLFGKNVSHRARTSTMPNVQQRTPSRAKLPKAVHHRSDESIRQR